MAFLATNFLSKINQMLTRDDLIDILMERFLKPAPEVQKKGKTSGRLFLSEYDIRKKMAPGAQELRIPKGAIISPLAHDWLVLRRIRIIEE